MYTNMALVSEKKEEKEKRKKTKIQEAKVVQ
jgi:hypothetical protein